MDFKLEKIENSEAYIAIEIDEGRMDEAMDKAYKKVVKQVSIPGFRKGRAPRVLLEAHYGKEILLNEALEVALPDAYTEAIEALNIEPIAQPEFDFEDELQLETFKFTARVAVKPEVTLGDLEGLEIEIPKLQVSDQDLDARLEEMRARYAELEEKEDEPAQMGDTVTIDFEGFVDDVPFEGGKGEDYPLELGSGSFIPGFEEQLVGLRKGDSKDIEVMFPEAYHAEELAGKKAVFKVLIKKLEGKKLRELNDEFAQEVSQFDTLEELRRDMSESMNKNLEARRKEVLKHEVIEKALERCEMVVPAAAVKTQVGRMLEQMEQSVGSQGLTMEQYYQFTNSTEDDLRTRMWPDAERSVKSDFMLEKLVEEKGFTASDEEVDKRIEDIAAEMHVDLDNTREILKDVTEKIRFGVQIDKAVDYLIEKAIITEKEFTTPPSGVKIDESAISEAADSAKSEEEA